MASAVGLRHCHCTTEARPESFLRGAEARSSLMGRFVKIAVRGQSPHVSLHA
jgi:hypothetical protein